MMRFMPQLVLAVVVALAVGFGYRAYDLANNAEWMISPAQIADAKATGKPGVETAPGTVAVLPIRYEMADMLPFKWMFAGAVAGYLVFSAGYMLNRNRSTIRITKR